MLGIDFLIRLAAVAEEFDHHPDIDIRYKQVRVALTTHTAGGITELDFRVAFEVNRLVDATLGTES